MKKTYDLKTNCATHSVDVYEYGFFETLKAPFNPNDYITVERNSAFYRVRRIDSHDDAILYFLSEADRPNFKIPVEGAEPDRSTILARRYGLSAQDVQAWMWGRKRLPRDVELRIMLDALNDD